MFNPRQMTGRDVHLDARHDRAQRALQASWQTLSLASPAGDGLTLDGSNAERQRLQAQGALNMPHRADQNRANGKALIEGGRRAARAQAIDATFTSSDQTLADEGRAHRERAAMMMENAIALTEMAHRSDAPLSAMPASLAARGSQLGAIHAEIKGIAALEGRAGIEARTGLSGEALDTLIAQARAGALVRRHADQAPAAQKLDDLPPRDAWLKKAETMSLSDFSREVSSFRSQKIEELYSFPGADRDTRARGIAMRKMNAEAGEKGLTSGESLRVNQRLWSDLEPESKDKEAMAAIRSVTLDQRKAQRADSEAAR